MNLANFILGGLGSAILTGGVSIWIFVHQNKATPKPRQVKDAWHAQAKELTENVNNLWNARAVQYERTIAYLEAQVEGYQRAERERD